jgi:hypothetical protein
MKKQFLVLALLAALVRAQAQPAEIRPAAPTTPRGGLPGSPASPGLPASSTTAGFPGSPATPGTFGFTNTLGTGTNLFGTNFLADLRPLLDNLQNDLEQLLPALAAINNNFASGNFVAAAPGAPEPGTGANFSGNASVDLSSGSGANLGTSLAVPVGGTTPTPAATASTANAAAGTIPPSATGSSSGFGSAAGTNFFVTPAAANTLQALIVLQNDVQRMLPVIVSLNGGDLDPARLNAGRGTNAVGLNINRVAPATTRAILPAPGSPAATGQTRP